MKARPVVALAFASLLLLAHRANADDGVTVETDPPKTSSAPAATAPAPAPYERTTRGTNGEIESGDGPRARVGFQMAVRTGYSLPLGSAAAGLKMSDVFGGQVPIIVDIGGKVHPNIFVGGYFGLAFGGCGDELGSSTTCLSDQLTVGAEILFSILPDSTVDPWVGYGIGLGAAALATNGGSAGFSGIDFGHFMGGVDFRVSRGFGIGPFVDLGVGEYMSVNETDLGSGTVSDKTFHEWITLGARFVVFP